MKSKIILKLSVRTVNAFYEGFYGKPDDVVRVGKRGPDENQDIWECSPEWIARIVSTPPARYLKCRNLGVKTAKEMVEALELAGIKVKGERPWEVSKRLMVCPHCGERILKFGDLLK